MLGRLENVAAGAEISIVTLLDWPPIIISLLIKRTRSRPGQLLCSLDTEPTRENLRDDGDTTIYRYLSQQHEDDGAEEAEDGR